MYWSKIIARSVLFLRDNMVDAYEKAAVQSRGTRTKLKRSVNPMTTLEYGGFTGQTTLTTTAEKHLEHPVYHSIVVNEDA